MQLHSGAERQKGEEMLDAAERSGRNQSVAMTMLRDVITLVRLFEAVADGTQPSPHCSPDLARELLPQLRRNRDQLIGCAFDLAEQDGRLVA